MKIFDKIAAHFKANKPFVVYRKPNSKIVSGIFQQNDTLNFVDDFTEKGFVFAPFDKKEKAILIPEDISIFFEEEVCLEKSFLDDFDNFYSNEFLKRKHIDIVEKTIHKIKNSELQKIVISRKEEIKFPKFSFIETYKTLLLKYKNAFGYVWFHPKIGLWLGATPETLLTFYNNHFKTMSLAGTQVYKGTENVTWQTKELEEQELVTQFIKKQLQDITTDLTIKNKETTKAGNLLHLKTVVSGKLNQQNSTFKKLVNALHPTPAVCGLPRETSKSYILENEGYNRTYYTGFLGELHLQNKSSLFVNLRCMEVDKNIIKIYVGGGITKDSNALKEWEETVSKSKVMKSIL